VKSIFWNNTLKGGISTGARYEIDITNGGGVRESFIHGETNDLRGTNRSSGEHLRSAGSALRRAVRAAGAGVRGGRLPAGGRGIAQPHQPVADRDYGSRASIRELSGNGPALPADQFGDRAPDRVRIRFGEYCRGAVEAGRGGRCVYPVGPHTCMPSPSLLESAPQSFPCSARHGRIPSNRAEAPITGFENP
jgi:hypothetical protein